MTLSIEERVGISTHFLPSTYGETLEDAVKIVSDAGIKCFELVPIGQAQIGYPYNYPNVGLWPRSLSENDKRRLKDVLSVFDLCTIHSPHLDLNIASYNAGIREESIRQYMECLELAVNLEIELVTFHSGGQTRGFIRSRDEIARFNLEFAEKASSFAQEHGIKVGYETGSWKILRKVFEKTTPNKFGLNLDIGHTVMQGIDPSAMMEEWKDRLIEVHFNGVCHYWGGFMEHVPIHRNNALDYQEIIQRMKNIGFEGPIICELQGNDIQQACEAVVEARDLIKKLWKAPPPRQKIKPWNLFKSFQSDPPALP